MDSQAPISVHWAPRLRWVAVDMWPASGSLAIGISVALHVAAAGWALSIEPTPPVIAEVATTQLVRAVHQDVVLERPAPPPVAPPPAPEPVKLAPTPKPVAAKPPPPKRRKRARKKQQKKTKPAAAFEQKTAPPSPAPATAPMAAAAMPVNTAATGAGVAVQTSAPTADNSGQGAGAVDPRAGHVDGVDKGKGVDLAGYGARVRAAVQRRQHYPEAAEDDGLEGTVRVRVTLRPDGTLVAAPKVVRSSGHRSLDKEAVRMVKASAPFTRLPAGFTAGTAELTIPIVFELEDDDF